MPYVISAVNDNSILAAGLQAVHYLSSTTGEVVITMIYDRFIECDSSNHQSWFSQASDLRHLLLSQQTICCPLSILNIIGRSKKQKIVIGCNYIYEHLSLKHDGRVLRYKQVDDGFSNPNALVNMKALDWICMVVKEEIFLKQSRNNELLDLLEMYCGNGNHTVALAGIVLFVVSSSFSVI